MPEKELPSKAEVDEPLEKFNKMKFGEIAISLGYISDEQLNKSLSIAKMSVLPDKHVIIKYFKACFQNTL